MEGRWKQLVSAGVLCSLAGCSSLWSKKNNSPYNTPEPPVSKVPTKSSSMWSSDDNRPPRIETLLAFANAALQSGGLPDRSDRDRDAALNAARDKFNEVLKREPKNVDAMLGMARSYKMVQDKDNCVQWYTKATTVQPKNAAVWGEMGQTLDGLRDREAAINCYHTAVKLDSQDKNYRKALGFALARTGRYADGYYWLSRCMSPADAHNCVARMMDHNGEHDLANREFAAAMISDPNNESARGALTNAGAPNDGIPLVSPVTPVNYEVPQRPAAMRNDGEPVPQPRFQPPSR